MKDSVWYNKLWHNKMQELPVPGDANAAWQKMQALLDDHMPANDIKPGRSLGSNLLLLAAIAIIAALLYYAGARMLAKHHPVTEKPKKHANVNNAEQTNGYQKTKLTSANLPAINSNRATNNINISANNNSKSAAKNASNALKANTVSNQNNSSSATTPFVSGAIANSKGHIKKNQVKNNNPVFAARSGSSPILRPGIFKQSYKANKTLASKTGENTPLVNNNADVAASSTAIIPGGNTTAQITNQQGNGTTATQATDTSTLKPVTTAANQQRNTTALATKTAGGKKVAAAKKTKPAKVVSYSSFEVGLNFGGQTNRGVFAGVSGTYYINRNLGIGMGANISQRLISGGYSNGNYKYTFSPDTSKAKTYTADKLVVTSSQKIYTVDIPILVTYKISHIISLKGGAVISMPVKTGTIKNNLGAINNPVDTIKPYRVIDTAAHSTTINSRVNFSLSGGIHLNLNRFSIDADYVQGLSPYTTSSGLGSGKSYYHTFQFGVSFILFKTKKK